MNPIIKILSSILGMIGGSIDSMNRKTAETIKQIFYTIAFLLVVTSAIMGVYFGKRAVKPGVNPLVKYTNQVFDIDIKMNRDKPWLGTMIEGDKINEIQDPDIKRILYPSKESPEPEVREGIVEPDPISSKKKTGVEADVRDRVAEIDRTDETPKKSDVRNIKRRQIPEDGKGPNVIGRDEWTSPVSETDKDAVTPGTDIKRPANKPSSDKSHKPGQRSLNPMDRDRGIIEK